MGWGTNTLGTKKTCFEFQFGVLKIHRKKNKREGTGHAIRNRTSKDWCRLQVQRNWYKRKVRMNATHFEGAGSLEPRKQETGKGTKVITKNMNFGVLRSLEEG